MALHPALWLMAGAVVAFHAAYAGIIFSFLIVVYLYCLYALARLRTSRLAFYSGLGIGMAIYAPQLSFFWTLFGPAAMALWLVLAFWIGVFLLLGHLCLVRLGKLGSAMVIPFLWTGLEYFRSELYFLRFSWLNVGYVFSEAPQIYRLAHLGVYGMGFGCMGAVAAVSLFPARFAAMTGAAGLALLVFFTPIPLKMNTPFGARNSRFSDLGTLRDWSADNPVSFSPDPSVKADRIVRAPEKGEMRLPRSSPAELKVAGMQLEFPGPLEVVEALDKLHKDHPEADLFMLSEYTFDGPISERVKSWCRKNRHYLIVGGKEPAAKAEFYNTAFVINAMGEVAFRQAKSVPIQFFQDGLPARAQQLWESPWGKLGVCICYDLNYRRVTDRLIRLGAQALLVPTMDVETWGAHQHRLHSRIAPARAAEYGVPVFRVASSGISQLVDADGRVTASAPVPGQQAMIAGTLRLASAGAIPLDAIICPVAVGITLLVTAWLWVSSFVPAMGKTVYELKRRFH